VCSSDLSESYFTQAIRLDANNSDAWSGLGNLAQMRGDQANAMTAYEKAIKSKPGNYEATINLAAIYDSVGQVERAEMLRQRAALLPH
jgi:Tfp pilus assembly protein PilF